MCCHPSAPTKLTIPTTPSTHRSHPASQLSPPSSPGIAKPSTRYHSSNLTKLNPSLAFKKCDSVRVASAAAEADICRDRFKAARKSLAEAAGAARDGDTAEVREERKGERRKLLNRSSACASRLRKEAYCSGLERELEDLERRYKALQVRAWALEKREEEMARKVGTEIGVVGEIKSDVGIDDRDCGGQERCRGDEQEVRGAPGGAYEEEGEDENESPEDVWPSHFEMTASLFGNDPSVPELSSHWMRDPSVGTGLDFTSFLL